MAEFTWTFDSPTGTYKQHALSRRLLYASYSESVCPQFAGDAGGYGRKQGESVTWTRVAALAEPTSPVLPENEDVPLDEFQLSTRSAVVQPIGRAVRYSSLADDLAFFDLENPIQGALREQMTLSLDTLCAAAMKDVMYKYVPTGATSNNVSTNGTFATAATVNLGVWHLEEIYDLLYDTLHAPPYEGSDYMGIFRWLALRGISRDPDFEELAYSSYIE